MVAVEGATPDFDKLFDYAVPPALANNIAPGMRVVVPFGKVSAKREGIVFEVSAGSEFAEHNKLKPIIRLYDDVVLSPIALRLCRFLKTRTLCTYYDAAKLMLPVSRGGREVSAAADTFARLAMPYEQIADNSKIKLTEKQSAVVNLLSDIGSATKKELRYLCGVTESVIASLKNKGVVEFFKVERLRTPYGAYKNGEATAGFDLSREQNDAYAGLMELIRNDKPEAALLFGVTGSGKTEIFIKLIEKVLESGKNVILTVPEIALTPMMAQRFCARFGDAVAIVHSGLSVGERYDEYRRINEGKARLVIGTRSALFSPVAELGLIIIDEEHESSYKSESNPRYHAHDVAKFLAVQHCCPVVFASATPSAESYYNAKSGKYKLFELSERFSVNGLPSVYIIDMATERHASESGAYSELLVSAIDENIKNGQQTILFLNRRGFYTHVTCKNCSSVYMCDHCSISYNYHKQGNRLVCHYCGDMREISAGCAKCGGRSIKYTGIGTQRLEDELQTLLPHAKILRMDADTTTSRYSYEEKFSAFKAHEYDVMIGTQMVAKGLDFPLVTLVGIIAADNMLYASDFRAYEKSFSLLTQVIGRSGRSVQSGRAVIQTYSPNHYILERAAAQDYKGFFENEIISREIMTYPPFCDLCGLLFTGGDDEITSDASKEALAYLKEAAPNFTGMPIRILGPTPCAVHKIGDKYRHKLIIKCKNNAQFREYLTMVMKKLERVGCLKKVSLAVDFYYDGNF